MGSPIFKRLLFSIAQMIFLSLYKEAIAADTQKAAKEQFEKLSEGFEKMTTFGQENIDAMVKSSEVATKAAEGFGAEISTYSKKAFEDIH